APIVITDLRTAEMIKYASNAFLATKISFINEIANICELLGADVEEVATGMGFDDRIGPHFLGAGLGYGGSCFPKDVKALAFMAEEMNINPQIIKAAMETNDGRRIRIIERLEDLVGDLSGKQIGLFGLAFKPNTDDMREAASLEIVDMLIERGAEVKAFDPVAMDVARPMMPQVTMVSDAYEAAEDCDAVIVVTEWNEFKQVDLDKLHSVMKRPVIVDGRNIYDMKKLLQKGFVYRGVGRGYQAEYSETEKTILA
ncbi:MAG: nucleotide sugar dehydrogenase, partial [Chloroflexota bacterium]